MEKHLSNAPLRYKLPGKVYLAGAGPGSADLLTVRALKALQTADIVFHDDLVSDEVLSRIPARVAVFSAGKRCGTHKTSQEEIQQRIIAAAQNGKTVVRLKGGDPLIFARTHEEIAALREKEIEFEIIPGVTAATAAAAAAKIPLTERHNASKLVLVSNHHCAGKERRSWHESVATDATLVFYMPGSDFTTLRTELLENGVREEMACLLVSHAARPNQRLIRTTVGELLKAPALPAPCLLIVGPTAASASGSEHAAVSAKESAVLSGLVNEISLDLFPAKEVAAD